MEDLSDSDVGDLILALGERKTISTLSLKSSLSAKSVMDIFNALHKQKCLAYIALHGVKTITLDIAVMALYLIQSKPLYDKRGSNSIWIAEDYQTPRQKDSICLLVTVDKDTKDLRLTLAWRPATEDSNLSLGLDLTLPNMDIIIFKEYLKKCQDLHENPAIDELMEALFSSLHSDTDLRHLKQRVRCLTLGRTLGRLSLQTFPNLKELKVTECKQRMFCTTLSFERAGSQRMDTIISFGGSRVSVSYVSIRLSNSSDMTTHDFTGFILIFDTYQMGRSGMNCADGDVDAPLSSLCSVPDLKTVKMEVTCMTLSLAAGSLCLIQTHPSLEEIKIVREQFTPSTSTEEISYHYSSLCFTKDSSTQSLIIGIATKKPEAAVPYISLFLSQTSVKSFDLKDFLSKFDSLKHSHQLRSPQRDEHYHALMSSLHSLPGLREMKLEVGSLTTRWAKRILSLIHSCPTLQKLHVYASDLQWTCSGYILSGGFLTKESIRLLQMAPKRPDCTLILHGKWCFNTTWQCRTVKYRPRKCNGMVAISITENSSRMKRSFKMSWKGMTMWRNIRRWRRGGRRRDGQSER